MEISAFCEDIHVPSILSAFRGNIHVPWILSAFRSNIRILWKYPHSVDKSALNGFIHIQWILSVFFPLYLPHFSRLVKVTGAWGNKMVGCGI